MADIRVFEGNAPLLTIRIKRKTVDGDRLPYLLSGNPGIDLYVKSRKSDTDAAAKFHYAKPAEITIVDDGSGVDDTYSEITIQCAAVDIAPPGSYPFHLDVTKAGLPETVMAGQFIIENT